MIEFMHLRFVFMIKGTVLKVRVFSMIQSFLNVFIKKYLHFIYINTVFFPTIFNLVLYFFNLKYKNDCFHKKVFKPTICFSALMSSPVFFVIKWVFNYVCNFSSFYMSYLLCSINFDAIFAPFFSFYKVGNNAYNLVYMS